MRVLETRERSRFTTDAAGERLFEAESSVNSSEPGFLDACQKHVFHSLSCRLMFPLSCSLLLVSYRPLSPLDVGNFDRFLRPIPPDGARIRS